MALNESVDNSPYAPPKAVLADAPPAPVERPPQVARAVKCLWTVFGIGLVFAAWKMIRIASGLSVPVFGSTFGSLVFYVVLFLFSFVLYRFIGKGRNWARIFFIVLSVIGLLTLPFIVYAAFMQAQPVLDSIVGIFNSVLSMYACYLLLTRPVREWFHAMKG